LVEASISVQGNYWRTWMGWWWPTNENIVWTYHPIRYEKIYETS
jgi:hypothetical protein